MSEDFYSYKSRTLCDVLAEMRKCGDTRNYSYLNSLIEEVQSMGNKMESALSDRKDIKSWSSDWTMKKAEMKKLYAEIKELKARKEVLTGSSDGKKQE